MNFLLAVNSGHLAGDGAGGEEGRVHGEEEEGGEGLQDQEEEGETGQG